MTETAGVSTPAVSDKIFVKRPVIPLEVVASGPIKDLLVGWTGFEGLLSFGVLFGQHVHDLNRSPILVQQRCHDLHRTVDVSEESLVPGTQVIQSWLTIRGLNKAVLGTAPVAGKTNLAIHAIARQGSHLVLPKLELLVRGDQLDHVGVIYIP